MHKILILILVPLAQCSCPSITSRFNWNATSPKSTTRLRVTPPPFIVIHHSDSFSCNTTSKCKKEVKNIQNYHMNNKGWNDIGYNFLVGGDGEVYEGRGWSNMGAHCRTYNAKSIGICVLGNFKDKKPPNQQLQAVKNLISCAEYSGYVSPDYQLIGHRQEKITECPGDKLFSEISTWPHFNASVIPT